MIGGITMARDYTLKVKISEEEKNSLEQNAHRYGGSVSSYVRHKLFSTSENCSSDGIQIQRMVECLSKFSRLTAQISDQRIRQELEHSEVEMWQLLK